ncbi:hypothetical protein KUTeg_024209 [Tegillarca granosa]|uniref:Uncharacterized protein n=1 Tax=Tegillarca granosa TaxID=220873 RepID=A0ABQ9DWP7_TEGGR|nr:hypothetical protein KUTeg_024209 [Tegillarca granosa]
MTDRLRLLKNDDQNVSYCQKKDVVLLIFKMFKNNIFCNYKLTLLPSIYIYHYKDFRCVVHQELIDLFVQEFVFLECHLQNLAFHKFFFFLKTIC